MTAPGFEPVKKIIDANHEVGVPADLDGPEWMAGQLSKNVCAQIYFEVCGPVRVQTADQTPAHLTQPHTRVYTRTY